LECTSGGGGKLEWYDWLFGMTVNGVPMTAYENGQQGGPDGVSVVLFANGVMSINMTKEDFSHGVVLSTVVGNPPSTGTYNLGGYYYNGVGQYQLTAGSLTITKAPKSLPERLEATFQFTTNGGHTVTAGSFSIWLYPAF
jgi:hypothetical protein